MTRITHRSIQESTLANLIHLVAMVKILISFTWMIVISRNLTMGVAWHRFTVFFNIWFKRKADGTVASVDFQGTDAAVEAAKATLG